MALLFHSPTETLAAGRRLGSALKDGDIVGLTGPLGVGKTTFVRGVAEGAKVLKGYDVTSPTFVFLRQYQGPLPISHIDLYRIEREEELQNLGLEEVVGRDGAALIEWWDRFPDYFPGDRLEIRMAFGDGDTRRVDSLAVGARGAELCRALEKTV